MSDIVERLKAAEVAMRWDGIRDAIEEIERLRGLLREAPKHPMTKDLQKRVREALGERQ